MMMYAGTGGEDISLLIGITGNSGCGQTTAASFLEEYVDGICSLDRVGHRLLAKRYVKRELAAVFRNAELETMDPAVLRQFLSSIVFGDDRGTRSRSSLSHLNEVLHPRMVRWARRSAEYLSTSSGIWILEGALIFELGIHRYLDFTILIRDSEARCASRLTERDGVDADTVATRWRNQMDLDRKALLAYRVIENSRGLNYLRKSILSIFDEITNQSY
jgi:dephospho-CoA kinase